jgi:hypothetical protein
VRRLSRRSFSFALAAALAPGLAVALACTGCTSGASGSLKLVTGEEDAAATFADVSTVSVTWVDQSNNSHSLATTRWPATTIDLGSVNQSSVGMIEVTGSDDAGDHLVFGSTIPVPFGLLDGVTVPVFVQRVGELARLPAPLSDGRPAPLLGVVDGRYVLVAGGSDPAVATTSQLYDLLAFGPLTTPPTLPVAAESMALAGTVAYLTTSSGVTAFDLSDSDAGAFALPAGGPTAADIAGGATFSATDGTQYIVGGTRTTHGPTTAVLRLDTGGNASWITLSVPRWGATAAWVDNLGLVVVGGSASPPGAELIPVGGTNVQPLMNFPADPSVGAGAATLDDARTLIVAGGFLPDLSDPGVRVFDLQCSDSCAPTVWPPLPISLRAQAFGLPGKKSAIVVGNELAGGQTHVFVLTSESATEVPTKVAHTSAAAVASPIGITPGAFLLFGGAPEIESYAPPF